MQQENQPRALKILENRLAGGAPPPDPTVAVYSTPQ